MKINLTEKKNELPFLKKALFEQIIMTKYPIPKNLNTLNIKYENQWYLIDLLVIFLKDLVSRKFRPFALIPSLLSFPSRLLLRYNCSYDIFFTSCVQSINPPFFSSFKAFIEVRFGF